MVLVDWLLIEGHPNLTMILIWFCDLSFAAIILFSMLEFGVETTYHQQTWGRSGFRVQYQSKQHKEKGHDSKVTFAKS
jgi:hypothetical protein